MKEEEKYKKAINELADSYELHLKQWAKRCIDTINEYTTNLQQELQQKENIIKEVREYINEDKNCVPKHIFDYLNKILDKVGDINDTNINRN